MLAGCPKEVCSKCGKPKVAIVKVTRPEGYETSLKETSDYEHNIVRSAEVNYRSPGSATNIRPLTTLFKMAQGTTREVIGSKATCSCDAPFVAGTVLDPFAGSGTTLMVAKQLGYEGIGFEINPSYISIIERRCKIKESIALGQLEYTLVKPSHAVEAEPISDITWLK